MNTKPRRYVNLSVTVTRSHAKLIRDAVDSRLFPSASFLFRSLLDICADKLRASSASCFAARRETQKTLVHMMEDIASSPSKRDGIVGRHCLSLRKRLRKV